MRFKAKVDVNQREITTKLRELGFSVLCLHTVGKGCPDLLVGKNGVNYLIEVKSSQKSKLTADEERFFETWKGQVSKCHNIDEVLNIFNR